MSIIHNSSEIFILKVVTNHFLIVSGPLKNLYNIGSLGTKNVLALLFLVNTFRAFQDEQIWKNSSSHIGFSGVV